jgi:DNA-binding winged helix-turn-helix (wHTH) protein
MRIGGCALDVLTVLVDHAGKLVSKDEVIARAWPNTKVAENNLRVHIGAPRKVLGESPRLGSAASQPRRASPQRNR